MTVSIDAVVGQRAIDAANNEGADIEGVTSIQGTPVSPVEQQVTFGGYPNQTGPSLLANQGLINQNTNVIDIINSLHPDFVATASPIELDYAIAVAQGKAPYEEGVLSGPTVSRQPPWAGTRTQTTGTGPTRVEATAKEIEKYEKAIKETEKSQAKIAKINKQLQQQIDNMQRWYTSPARAEALLGPPIPQVAGPTVYSGTPTFVEDESAWGAGAYQPTINIEKEAPLGKIDITGQGTTPLNTLEQWQDWVENPVNTGMQGLSGSYNIGTQAPWVESTTKKDTKSKYGTWDGLFNKKTAEENLKAQRIFQKAFMDEFEEKYGSAKHWGLTKATKTDGTKLTNKENKMRNRIMKTDQFLNAYDAVYGTSKGAKMIANALSKGVGFVGGGLQSFVNKKGAGNADTLDQVIDKIESGEYEIGQAEVPAPDPREKVTGGFWGLMAFAKKNPKIFGSLSGDELWSLISDPDGFWEFYEAALAGD